MSQHIIKRRQVQLRGVSGRSQEASDSLTRGGTCAPSGEKAVRLLQDDGRVHAIEFTCACGEVTCIELAYPDETDTQ
jgi:hypothetical protein